MYRQFRGLGLLAALTLSLALAGSLHGQVAGAMLTGTVSDQSGAIVPNAKVAIKSAATGLTREITSDADGVYSAPNLPPGKYDVIVSAGGFATLVQKDVTLTVGESQLLNVSLRIGQSTQTVQVSAGLPTVDLASSTMSDEVNSTTVRELPLNGRDWTLLATLQPGASAIRPQAATTSTANRANRGLGNQLTANGHRPFENNYRMDGISINDYTNAAPGSVLGLELGVDAVQEFSVELSNYSAAYGKTTGAVINAITKSGTNSFHGDAYWFLRNSYLDARNFFDPAKIPPFRRNQFGGSAGGPIQKDKMFVFADFEGIRQSLATTSRNTVPTAAARAGNLCSQPNLGSGSPCSPTTVQVDPEIAHFLQLYPLPNAGVLSHGDIGIFNSAPAVVTSENHVVTRVDRRLSGKDTLSGTYFYDSATQTFPDAFLSYLSSNTSGAQMLSLEETHVFGPTLVNTIRLGWSRTRAFVSPGVSAINPLASDTSFGVIAGGGAPTVSISGLTLMPGGLGANSLFNHHQDTVQFYDDAFWNRGVHSLKFGFAVEHFRYNLFGENRPNGQVTFPSLQAFLLNQPSAASFPDTVTIPPTPTGTLQNLFGVYAQDDWRVRPNLTLNLGLRYEPSSMPSEEHGRWQVLTNLFTGVPTPTTSLWANNYSTRNFAPRVGLSYDPFHNGKTAIRAGFGIFDVDFLPWIYTQGNSQVFPFELTLSVNPPIPTGVFPNGLVGLATPTLANTAVRYIQQNTGRTYSMNWNFNIQREIARNTTVTVGYVGQHTVRNPFDGGVNEVLGTPTAAGLMWSGGKGTRLNPLVGSIRGTTFDTSAHYSALEAQMIKRMSRGIQFQTSYTYSKCIDYGSAGAIDNFLNSGASGTVSGELSLFPNLYRRGLCDFDVRQIFVGNVVWMLPNLHSSSRFVSHTLGGWELNGIFSASSGSPFTPGIGGAPLGSNTPASRPDRLMGGGCNNPVNPQNANQYIKVNCFTPPVVPSSLAASLPFPCVPAAAAVGIPNTCMNLFGNVGRNSVIGPGLEDFDAALIKNTYIARVSETFNVQFRVEMFNVFNRANFQAPNPNDGNSIVLTSTGTVAGTGGVLVSTVTPSRQLQLALKIIW
jgi:outer membrane receptor protein involved in Fe transport